MNGSIQNSVTTEDDSGDKEDDRDKDEEQLVEEDTNREETVEITVDEIIGEIGPELALNNWQGGECGQIFDIESDLKDHMDEKHISQFGQDEKKSLEKKLETLQRGHEQLKNRYEQAGAELGQAQLKSGLAFISIK